MSPCELSDKNDKSALMKSWLRPWTPQYVLGFRSLVQAPSSCPAVSMEVPLSWELASLHPQPYPKALQTFWRLWTRIRMSAAAGGCINRSTACRQRQGQGVTVLCGSGGASQTP